MKLFRCVKVIFLYIYIDYQHDYVQCYDLLLLIVSLVCRPEYHKIRHGHTHNLKFKIYVKERKTWWFSFNTAFTVTKPSNDETKMPPISILQLFILLCIIISSNFCARKGAPYHCVIYLKVYPRIKHHCPFASSTVSFVFRNIQNILANLSAFDCNDIIWY